MAKPPRSLAGQVVAITGGARGIGRATAEACIAQGMRVSIGDVDAALAERTAAELGHGTIALALDVTDRASFRAYLDATEERLGPVDVLINNAGIMQVGPFLDEDDATARRQIDININGVLYGMKEVLPRMLGRRRGHLVNIASVAGKTGFPGGVTYCGTKHFVVGASEAIRAELRGSGVEVGVVMPALVNTELASGTPDSRFVQRVEPQDVAAEIVDALQHPRFEIFVPRLVGGINKVMSVLPRPGREAIGRALKADQVLVQIDTTKRQAYELRAGQSQPAVLTAADEPAQIEQRTTGS